MLEVSVEVAAVRSEGVRSQAALDVEMRQPPGGRPLERGRAAQVSTCSSGIESSPNASATGAHVM